MGWEYPSWSHVNGPAVNLLKGGVLTADRVMTVSKVGPQHHIILRDSFAKPG